MHRVPPCVAAPSSLPSSARRPGSRHSIYPLIVPRAIRLTRHARCPCQAPEGWTDRRLLERNLGLPTPTAVSEPPTELADRLTLHPSWGTSPRCSSSVEIPWPGAPIHARARTLNCPTGLRLQTDFCIAVGDDIATWLHFWNWPLSLSELPSQRAWNALCLPLGYFGRRTASRGASTFLRRYAHRSGSTSPIWTLFLQRIPPQISSLSGSGLTGGVERKREGLTGWNSTRIRRSSDGQWRFMARWPTVGTRKSARSQFSRPTRPGPAASPDDRGGPFRRREGGLS